MRIKAFAPIIFIGFIVAIAYNFIALADIDAPHNEANSVSCGNCHGQELLQSPFWGGSMSYDELCTNCHKVSSGPYTETNAPSVKTHSSGNTSNQYGEWSWECRDCHEPHYQKQKNFKNTDSGNLYLATGIITSCSYNSVNNTSTLMYSSMSFKSCWDATKVKEKTTEFRRTILFPNLEKLGYSYPVTAIDGSTITVKGDATPVYQYITESTFAIMYGQYVKDIIDNKQVKFFDQEWSGSFADRIGVVNGVCEVCHTKTTYHKNNGLGDLHYQAVRCSICHAHIDGFASSDQGSAITIFGYAQRLDYSYSSWLNEQIDHVNFVYLRLDFDVESNDEISIPTAADLQKAEDNNILIALGFTRKLWDLWDNGEVTRITNIFDNLKAMPEFSYVDFINIIDEPYLNKYTPDQLEEIINFVNNHFSKQRLGVNFSRRGFYPQNAGQNAPIPDQHLDYISFDLYPSNYYLSPGEPIPCDNENEWKGIIVETINFLKSKSNKPMFYVGQGFGKEGCILTSDNIRWSYEAARDSNANMIGFMIWFYEEAGNGLVNYCDALLEARMLGEEITGKTAAFCGDNNCDRCETAINCPADCQS